MWILFMYVMISVVVPMIMGLLSWLVSARVMSSDTFECGFDSFNVSVLPVSLRFFVFCIIFLILDLELIIMSVTPMVLWVSGFIVNIIIFLFLVTMSLLVEWLYGSLSWIE